MKSDPVIRKGRGGVPRVRMPGLVTQAELARTLGVTPVNIIRAIELGRLKPTAFDGDDRAWFDEAEAVATYNANTRRRIDKASAASNAPALDGIPAAPTPPTPADTSTEDGDEAPGAGGDEAPGAGGAESYNEARRRLAIADANKRELEVAERKGALVARDSVVRALTAAGTSLKDRLSGLGARLAAGLAAETDPRKTKEAIDDAVREALIALRRDIEKALPVVKEAQP